MLDGYSTARKRPFKNIVEKGKNERKKQFIIFPHIVFIKQTNEHWYELTDEDQAAGRVYTDRQTDRQTDRKQARLKAS